MDYAVPDENNQVNSGFSENMSKLSQKYTSNYAFQHTKQSVEMFFQSQNP